MDRLHPERAEPADLDPSGPSSQLPLDYGIFGDDLDRVMGAV
jgi:hypothetical protein